MEEEEELKRKLRDQGTLNKYEYKQNRAIFFRGNRYHHTIPFEWKPGYENYRTNLNLLFGQRRDIKWKTKHKNEL